MKRRVQIRVPHDLAGKTVLKAVAGRFTYHSPDQWIERLGENRVHVNGHPATAGTVLSAGDLLEYHADDLPEPPVRTEIEVLHDDAEILVVNKPANLPSHPAGRYFNHTLWAILKTRFGIEKPTLVNRLDRETSGIILIAKTPDAAIKCRAQFAGRLVQKRYLVLVEGYFPDTLYANGFLTPDPDSLVCKKRKFALLSGNETPPPDGEPAETVFHRRRHANKISEVEAIPHTGRMHQIRATLHSLGFPVVGDKLYGPDPNIFLRFCTDALTESDRVLLRIDRQALHASGLTFTHPRTGTQFDIVSPIPPELDQLLS
jgi:23S rRNA pseudouridine955/2504/2580 synthase/23S rRNA pseudouridine1911/1915/1917 synthase